MTSPYTTIDYANTLFDYPVLTKIHGKPTFTALTSLKKQLKANARSVRSNLGGGAHGHLGLVLSPTEYALISNTPFVEPEHPGEFNVQPNIDSYTSSQQERAHAEQLRQFHVCGDVKQALIRQIVTAIDNHYLDELRDDSTSTITLSIPVILRYLFSNFARVTSKDVTKEEQRIKSYYWNLEEPPMIFYKMIEDLHRLTEAAGLPRTQEMLIDYGLEIVQRTGDMEKGQAEWYEMDEANHTWQNFKTHFTSAYMTLQKFAEPPSNKLLFMKQMH